MGMGKKDEFDLPALLAEERAQLFPFFQRDSRIDQESILTPGQDSAVGIKKAALADKNSGFKLRDGHRSTQSLKKTDELVQFHSTTKKNTIFLALGRSLLEIQGLSRNTGLTSILEEC